MKSVQPLLCIKPFVSPLYAPLQKISTNPNALYKISSDVDNSHWIYVQNTLFVLGKTQKTCYLTVILF